MIVADRKPLKEILEMVQEAEKLLIVGCKDIHVGRCFGGWRCAFEIGGIDIVAGDQEAQCIGTVSGVAVERVVRDKLPGCIIEAGR